MSTHMPGFQPFLAFLRDFVLANLPNSCIRVEKVYLLFLGHVRKLPVN